MDNSCVIYLVCRGATRNDQEPFEYQTILGQKHDLLLSTAGMDQVAQLGIYFTPRRVSHVYTSSAARATMAAMAISVAMEGVPVRITAALAAIDAGDWAGRIRKEVMNLPEYEDHVRDPGKYGYPGGESLSQVQRRVMSFIMAEAKAHPTESLAMVTHPDVIRTAVAYLSGLPLERAKDIDQGCGNVTLLRCQDGELSIGAVNQSAVTEERLSA
jgi:probable phosphoglycerate mutase